MATGLDTAAGIAGIITLCVSLFNGCVKIIKIISDATHTGKDVERISLMLELEQCRLLRWGERAGLCSELVQNERLNWDLIYQLLNKLHSDLTDAKILRDRYDLEEVEETTINGIQTLTDASMITRTKNPNLIERVRRFPSRTARHSRAKIIQETTSIFQKLRWMEIDHDKTRRLLQDIQYFNNALQDLLDEAHQSIMKAGMTALVRDLLSRSSKQSDIDTIQASVYEEAVGDALSLEEAMLTKKTRLVADLDRRSDEVRSVQVAKPRVRRLGYEKLSNLTAWDKDDKWQIAEYRVVSASKPVHSRVLLEWKTIPSGVHNDVRKRILGLSLLMATHSQHTFHTLKCLGFVERLNSAQDSMYAYVFELTDYLAPVPVIWTEPLLLSTILERPLTPSLTLRLRLCLGIAETVLQMHTAGWLHKGISAHAVILMDTALSNPFLAGYEFARNTFEETETMPFDTNLLLYQHSSLRIPEKNHVPGYRKEYDLHSLGCLLLEVILWSSLDKILTSADSTQRVDYVPGAFKKSADQLRHEREFSLLQEKKRLEDSAAAEDILSRVAFAGGDRAREAVELCFFPRSAPAFAGAEGSNDNKDGDDEYEDTVELGVDAQMSIVNIFRSLIKSV